MIIIIEVICITSVAATVCKGCSVTRSTGSIKVSAQQPLATNENTDPHHILQCDDLALQLRLHSAGPFNTRNISNLCCHSCIAINIYIAYSLHGAMGMHYQNVRAAHQLLASHCTKYICTAIWIKFGLSSRPASTIWIIHKTVVWPIGTACL